MNLMADLSQAQKTGQSIDLELKVISARLLVLIDLTQQLVDIAMNEEDTNGR